MLLCSIGTLSPACALLPNPSPHEVRVECQLLPQEPTFEAPDPPRDPCLPWRPEVVQAFLRQHVLLWRETFPDTDEWAAEAPLLPYLIEVEDAAELEPMVIGRTWGGNIRLAGRSKFNRNLDCSALPHELVHVALLGSSLDGDANHSEPGGPWTSRHTQYSLDFCSD